MTAKSKNGKTQTEIERKYDVEGELAVPVLAGVVAGIADITLHDPVALEAVYYDTDELRLSRRKVILRRREGGGDEGWHIKKPASEGRTEIHWPLGKKDVIPDAVLAPIRAIVRDSELTPLAQISTVRTAYHLLDGSGAPVAELADDTVTASDTRAGVVRSWREWEVELLPGAPDTEKGRTRLLDDIEEALRESGAHPSSSIAKIARALGADSLLEVSDANGNGIHARLDSDSPAGEVVVTAFRALLSALVAADPKARADEPDGVHQMRTVVRRLRSLLASYRRLFDRATTDDLRDRLKRLGFALGEARDAEVRGLRGEALVAELATELSDPDVAVRLADDAKAAYDGAHKRLLRLLSGEPYYRLLDSLEEFAAHPPFTERADRPAGKEIAKTLEREVERVRARAAAADRAEGDDRDLLLHGVRKAARRLRYAAEAMAEGETAVMGGKTRKLASAAEQIQDALGEHRDNTLFAQHLALTSNRAHAAGEKTFVYGVLYELSGRAAADALADSRAPLKDLR